MLKSHFRITVMAAAFSAMAATHAYAAVPVKTAETSLGPTLVDGKGMTLYTFAKDKPGKSACVAKCAANWPPLAAGASDKVEGDYTIITRADGSKQWAYKGKPLYTWVKDKKPGDTTGEGFLNGAWHAAKP